MFLFQQGHAHVEILHAVVKFLVGLVVAFAVRIERGAFTLTGQDLAHQCDELTQAQADKKHQEGPHGGRNFRIGQRCGHITSPR